VELPAEECCERTATGPSRRLTPDRSTFGTPSRFPSLKDRQSVSPVGRYYKEGFEVFCIAFASKISILEDTIGETKLDLIRALLLICDEQLRNVFQNREMD